jgi:Flp pilus assembly pilin Flp
VPTAAPSVAHEAAASFESLFGGAVVKSIKNALSKLVRDEQGGEVLEYALIAGLIIVAAIAIIGAVGTKVLARWTSLNSSM